jgi:preprotein translocase subunit SecB
MANGSDTMPQVGVLQQYVKDLSVENPNAPHVYNWASAPQINVEFNIGARPISDELHEVELKLMVQAQSTEGVAFAVELSYCGLFGLRNVPEQQVHAFLYAEAPRLLFPFARAILADAVRDAGFQPVMLDPIDFNGLYAQQLAQSGAPMDGQAPLGQA